VRLDLLDRLHVNERTDHRTRLEAVGDLHRTDGLDEPLGEGVVDFGAFLRGLPRQPTRAAWLLRLQCGRPGYNAVSRSTLRLASRGLSLNCLGYSTDVQRG